MRVNSCKTECTKRETMEARPDIRKNCNLGPPAPASHILCRSPDKALSVHFLRILMQRYQATALSKVQLRQVQVQTQTKCN